LYGENARRTGRATANPKQWPVSGEVIFAASGPVINLAARLVGVAAAGQILIAPETVRRFGQRYRLARLGRERLKNIAEAADVHRVLGLSAGPERRRFATVQGEGTKLGKERAIARIERIEGAD